MDTIIPITDMDTDTDWGGRDMDIITEAIPMGTMAMGTGGNREQYY